MQFPFLTLPAAGTSTGGWAALLLEACQEFFGRMTDGASRTDLLASGASDYAVVGFGYNRFVLFVLAIHTVTAETHAFQTFGTLVCVNGGEPIDLIERDTIPGFGYW
jgi:hypothetical protein